jgi:hypothetical protein
MRLIDIIRRSSTRRGLAISAAVITATAKADDTSALLSILERKGILTKAEAASVRTELAKEKVTAFRTEPASAEKIKLSTGLTELKLYGDLRLRYQNEQRDGQLDPLFVGVHQDRNEDDRSPSGSPQSRWRFRLRVGAEIKLGEHWFGGLELSTGQASDTGNQTFENGFDDYNIYISKAFLGWRPNDSLTLTAGKMPNPFYTTELVWDSDITPNGIAEVINLGELFSPAGEVDALNKDAKKAVAPSRGESPWG